ncbi:MAG: ferrous iron transport protein B [Bacteroidetes bacterium]|nr:ferrous iron transport protein B [Bacteroidota bacterium]
MKTQVIEDLPLITLIGPPNSGKTTLFNYLSGKNYKTVNYPGATVEYSISKIQKKFNFEANILDSPGIISLVPNSPDEKISIDSLYSHPRYGIPDLVIITIDSSQLSRHLLLAKQLIDSSFNVLIALTMVDLLQRKGFEISAANLKDELNCDVIIIDGRTGNGVDDLVKAIDKNLKNLQAQEKNHPNQIHSNFNVNYLLNSFTEFEQIEKRVTSQIQHSNRKINLNKANRQLKVLNNDLSQNKNSQLDITTLKIDKILLHKVWGIIIFFLVMAITFTSIFWFAQPIMNIIDSSFGFLSFESHELLGNNWFSDFIANGIISGTGAVLVFVPQILILFLILGLLEDTGYLARGAMLIDKPLSKIGLNGRSFVPMLSGFACAIPAILATRTIPNKRERLLTIFIIPLMSCSARLPVYALLLAFLFPANESWIAGLGLASIYILSIISSTTIAGLVNKFRNRIINAEDTSSFILELPAYRMPKFSVVLSNSYHSAKLYFKKAGPIILVLSGIIWFLTYFPNNNPKIDSNNLSKDQITQLENSERLSHSYAADLGKFIQPVMSPIGMDWRIGVSLISAFAAREVFVSSLALIFKVTGNEHTLQTSMLHEMRKATIGNTGKYLFTPATITGLIIFFVFALQCMSTMAVSRKETGSWRIPLIQFFLFTSIAYLFTFLAVNGLRAFGIN